MSIIQLQGVHNIRDLGGMKALGGSIRTSRLLRGSSLAEATEADIRVLTEVYRLRQIIDLRTGMEAADAPDVRIPGADYAAIPLIDEKAIGITQDRSSKQDLMGMMQKYDLTRMYEHLASAPRVPQWRSIFDILLTQREGATLWHCSEGKDRCGLVTAIVLHALGVSMEDIIADYLKTNEAAAPRAEGMYQAALKKTGDTAVAEKIRNVFLAKREYFDAAMAAIQKTHGSLDVFLEEVCGVDAVKRRTLRAFYCTEG